LVRYADKEGLPRSPEATPIEFSQNLKEEWPEAEAQLDQLTEAFLAARYTDSEINERQLKAAKAAWLQIRRRDRKQEA
jgi:hypothetical protein